MDALIRWAEDLKALVGTLEHPRGPLLRLSQPPAIAEPAAQLAGLLDMLAGLGIDFTGSSDPVAERVERFRAATRVQDAATYLAEILQTATGGIDELVRRGVTSPGIVNASRLAPEHIEYIRMSDGGLSRSSHLVLVPYEVVAEQLRGHITRDDAYRGNVVSVALGYAVFGFDGRLYPRPWYPASSVVTWTRFLAEPQRERERRRREEAELKQRVEEAMQRETVAGQRQELLDRVAKLEAKLSQRPATNQA